MTAARRRTGLALALALLAATAGCTGTLYERSATPATVPPDALDGTGFVELNVTAVPTTVRVLPPPLPGDVTATSYVAAYVRPGPNATRNGTSANASASASASAPASASASTSTSTSPGAREGEAAPTPASLVVVSSPSVRVAGRQANPLASLTRVDLALAVLDRLRESNLSLPGPAGRLDVGVDAEGDLRAVAEYEATILGSRTTAVVYAADARTRLDGNRTRAGTDAGNATRTDADADAAIGNETGNGTATGVGLRVLVATVEHGDDVVVVLGVTPRLEVPDVDTGEEGDGEDAALLELVERVEHDVE